MIAHAVSDTKAKTECRQKNIELSTRATVWRASVRGGSDLHRPMAQPPAVIDSRIRSRSLFEIYVPRQTTGLTHRDSSTVYIVFFAVPSVHRLGAPARFDASVPRNAISDRRIRQGEGERKRDMSIQEWSVFHLLSVFFFVIHLSYT